MEEPLVRQAFTSDKAGVRQLVNELFPASPYEYAQNILYPERTVNAVAVRPDAGVVGFASLLLDASPAAGPEEWRKYPLYVGVIGVRLAHRRHRVATRMLDLLRTAAHEKRPNYPSMYLHVSEDNAAATGCFERYGFKAVGEPEPTKDGSRACLMRMDVSGVVQGG
jgi:GNAT superfamily N-acetyltransferase